MHNLTLYFDVSLHSAFRPLGGSTATCVQLFDGVWSHCGRERVKLLVSRSQQINSSISMWSCVFCQTDKIWFHRSTACLLHPSVARPKLGCVWTEVWKWYLGFGSDHTGCAIYYILFILHVPVIWENIRFGLSSANFLTGSVDFRQKIMARLLWAHSFKVFFTAAQSNSEEMRFNRRNKDVKTKQKL